LKQHGYKGRRPTAPPIVEPYSLDGRRFGKPQKQLQDAAKKIYVHLDGVKKPAAVRGGNGLDIIFATQE